MAEKIEKRLGIRADLPPDQSSKDQLRIYMNAGFNILTMTEDFVRAESQAYLDCLKLCEEIGLDVYIRGYSLETPYYFDRHFPFTDFKKYPAVKGFFVTDEPWKEQLEEVAEYYVPWFNEKYADAGMAWYLNTYCGESYAHLGGTVKEHFDYAMKNVYAKLNTENKFFTSDEYPLRRAENGKKYIEDNKEFIPYTALQARVCRDNKVKFGGYIQSFSGFCDMRKPCSTGEFRFLAYTYLAFGVQQLSYFGYRATNEWGFDCIVTEDGRPTEQYKYVKELNKELLSFDREYLSYEWKGALIIDGSVEAETQDRFQQARDNLEYQDQEIKKVESEYDFIVGCFDDGEKKAYVLFNYGEPTVSRNNNVKLHFNSIKKFEVLRNGKRSVEEVVDGTLSLEIKNGDGLFIKEI